MKNVFLKLKENNEIKVTENTRYILNIPEFSADKAYSISLYLEKTGIEAEIIGVYKLYSNQHLNLTTEAIHKVPNTKCSTVIKGVLYDHSSSDYTGKIIIQKSAQQTNSYLDDNILVIGEHTRNNSQPILEIEADDVKASHGATTGKISSDQLYYLQSRGLSKTEAEDIIVKGFFESVVSVIDDDIVREEVWNRLNA